MDANLITVLAGVLGSVSGASAAIATTWIAQKNQTVRERAKWDTRKRETRRTLSKKEDFLEKSSPSQLEKNK